MRDRICAPGPRRSRHLTAAGSSQSASQRPHRTDDAFGSTTSIGRQEQTAAAKAHTSAMPPGIRQERAGRSFPCCRSPEDTKQSYSGYPPKMWMTARARQPQAQPLDVRFVCRQCEPSLFAVQNDRHSRDTKPALKAKSVIAVMAMSERGGRPRETFDGKAAVICRHHPYRHQQVIVSEDEPAGPFEPRLPLLRKSGPPRVVDDRVPGPTPHDQIVMTAIARACYSFLAAVSAGQAGSSPPIQNLCAPDSDCSGESPPFGLYSLTSSSEGA